MNLFHNYFKINKSHFLSFVLASFLLNFISCESECEEVEIEKVEWITTYIDKTKDTLVAYSVIENRRKHFRWNDSITHTLKIRNDNETYSNEFSLKVDYGYYDAWDMKDITRTKSFNFVTIPPGEAYTFSFNSQAGRYVNYDSDYKILQKARKFSYKERQDGLKTEMITVNSCEVNIEALEKEYNAIKELYRVKIEERGKNREEDES